MNQKNGSRVLMLFFFALTLVSFQLWQTEAQAQSSFFTSRGCVGCHGAPTVATCAGCHHHSGTVAATKNKTTSYSPGETVTVTLTSSGARTGWIGARLYDQNGAEIARSVGNQSGMGGSAVYPAILSAPAPATAGTYAWRMAYFGNEDGTGTGDVHSEKFVNVSITVAAAADTASPVVTFTLPATSTSLTVPITSLTATDNVAVTGYLITNNATAPLASAAGWTAAAPASVTAVAGSNTFYAWAKDAAGNVSAVKSASVTVTIPPAADTAAPVVTFTLPATATSLTVPVSSLSATDNVAVTGYLVNKVATPPLASAAGWTAAAPASVTAVAGSNTFYAWAKDAAGNVSAVKSASVTVTIPPAADAAAPVVTFTLPATATNLTILVSSFTATDNVAVTGYMINKMATPPLASAAGWAATAPASVIAAVGNNTFYAWAKDAAGNVSAVKSASVTVTIPPAADTAAPVVTFALPATATSLTVPVSSLSATDNVAVTGYMITNNATAPTASASGWAAAAPASVTAVAGSNTFYAWAKDAVGNVSLSDSATVVVTLTTGVDNPVLSVSTLDDGAVTNKPTINITGNATDPDGIKSVTVNGKKIKVKANGSFKAVYKLKQGANIITIVATDKKGNASSDIRTITYDKKAPALKVTAPADHINTTQSFITVSGSINETSTVTVAVNGGSPEFASIEGNSFTATVYLVNGVNTLIIKATDLGGNKSTVKRTVIYDDGKPDLEVVTPKNDITTMKPTLLLKGKVKGKDVKVTITMGANVFTPAVVKNNFSQLLTFTTAGEYEIDVTATDAGGSTTVERTVIYQTVNDDNDDD